MLSLTVFFGLLAGVMAQTINIERALIQNSEFFHINTCDDTTADGRFITSMNSALTQWKIETKQEFCSKQCEQDMCGCITTPPPPINAADQGVHSRRQTVNIDGIITDSTFINVNVCRMPKFHDLLKSVNSFLFDMKKKDFMLLCGMECTRDTCGCFTTTTNSPTTTSSLKQQDWRQNQQNKSLGGTQNPAKTESIFEHALTFSATAETPSDLNQGWQKIEAKAKQTLSDNENQAASIFEHALTFPTTAETPPSDLNQEWQKFQTEQPPVVASKPLPATASFFGQQSHQLVPPSQTQAPASPVVEMAQPQMKMETATEVVQQQKGIPEVTTARFVPPPVRMTASPAPHAAY